MPLWFESSLPDQRSCNVARNSDNHAHVEGPSGSASPLTGLLDRIRRLDQHLQELRWTVGLRALPYRD